MLSKEEDLRNGESLQKDVFFRSHVVELKAKESLISTYDEPIWPEYALIFDTETTLDPRTQSLLFGFYRVCQLVENDYQCVEEGILYADDPDPKYKEVISSFQRSSRSEVMNSDYDGQIHVYSRSEFVEKVFFEAVRTRSLIVTVNAPWDISRLAVRETTARNRAWTLTLSERVSKKTGKLEPNPERPRVRVTSKDSKSAFFSLTKPFRPEEWPTYTVGNKTHMVFRVLDLHTLGWALYNKSHSLKSICEALQTDNQKQDHDPIGTITVDELEYCRQDVRCTVDVLNSLKEEFDRHPFDGDPVKLYPDKAVSPASVGKAYLSDMGIIPPAEKFEAPDYIQGIAAQAYFGGRAEIKIRHTPVPVVLTDFSSQYPTINTLLGNPEILLAESLSFEDATDEVRILIEKISLDDCFRQDTWKLMRFFARIRPDELILPVRAEFNDDGVTKNIGVDYFTSREPVWVSGPDLIAAKLLSGKVPHIEKALRMVPHGIQTGLKPTNLRGMVEVDPRENDFFNVMVEQKEVNKISDKALSYFLKICANSTSYGIFFELTPKKLSKPIKVRVFSGEHSHEQSTTLIEKPGEWYFPPIAALITGGAHLLLAMLEGCFTEKDGPYLFCDTDSMCAVATRKGGWVPCSNGARIKALSWKDVEEISNRFKSLNCYDKEKVPGSILKIEKLNFRDGKQIELFGYAISAKRYALYRYGEKGSVVIVDAKAHGLGYLYPPKDTLEDAPESDWVFEAWQWLLQSEVATPGPDPEWFPIPAMMRMTVSTPAVLGILNGFTRAFNFVHVPLLFQNLCSSGEKSGKLSLIMPFSKHRDRWLSTKATDTRSGKEYSITLLDPTGRTNKVEVKCYGNILGSYREHPEAKFLGPDGKTCTSLTRGLLRRSHIVANHHRYIGKETSRRWEQGEDMSIVDFRSAEYRDGKAVASEELRKQIVDIGIRRTARDSGIHTDTITLITRRETVKRSTLAKLVKALDDRKHS